MFERAMYLVTLTIYTALVGVLLVHFEANILFVITFLSLLPTLLFWHLEKLHTKMIPLLLLIAVGVTAIFEVTAYLNGLWYELSLFDFRIFGLLPVEAFIAAFTHILYFIVMYEYFFDDSRSSGKKVVKHLPYLLGGIGMLLGAALAYVYVFSGILFSYPFALLLLGGSVIFFGGISIFKLSWLRILKKMVLFAFALLPISLVYEYVTLQNDIRFFANHNEYLYMFSFFGETLPLEELVFIFLIPFWIATIYELYFDDGK